MDHLLVLPSTHLTLRAEKILTAAGIRHRTVMKPRDISSDCGLAIRFTPEDADRVAGALADSGLAPARFFAAEGRSWKMVRHTGETGDGGVATE